MNNWRKIFSWQIQNDLEEFENVLKRSGCRYRIDGNTLTIVQNGIVGLPSLVSLPDNVHFSNNGYVDLSALTVLPESTRFLNRGDVFVEALTRLPKNYREIFHNDGVVVTATDTIVPNPHFTPRTRETNLKVNITRAN